jgi:hypothetical protein
MASSFGLLLEDWISSNLGIFSLEPWDSSDGEEDEEEDSEKMLITEASEELSLRERVSASDSDTASSFTFSRKKKPNHILILLKEFLLKINKIYCNKYFSLSFF